MKKIMILVVTVMMLTMIVTPSWAFKAGNGGGGVNNTPVTPFPGTGSTTQQPPKTVSDVITIIVNGKQINPDVPAFVDTSNRTLAPFRAIGEALGCQIIWINESQKVICEKEGLKVEMTVGKKNFIVNGQNKLMDTVPVVKNNRTFIPVRALSEALNCSVEWDPTTNTVKITGK